MGVLSPSRRDCPQRHNLSIFAGSWQSLGVELLSLWLSNHSQHLHSSRSAFVLWLQSLHRFSYGIVALLDQLRLGSFALAIRDLQALPLEGDGCPDILPHQSLRDLPALIQEANLPLRVDAANEVQASFRQRQLLGECAPFALCQPSARHAPLGCCHAHPAQPRWLILLVPSEEFVA